MINNNIDSKKTYDFDVFMRSYGENNLPEAEQDDKNKEISNKN